MQFPTLNMLANLLQNGSYLLYRQTLGGLKFNEFRQTQFQHLQIKANNVVVDESIVGLNKVEPVCIKLSQVLQHGHLVTTKRYMRDLRALGPCCWW